MDLLRCLIRRGWRPCKPQDRPAALENSELGKLPNDILQMLGNDYLSPVDRASLSLSCKPLLSCLGTKQLSAIKNLNDDQKYKFLRLLAVDSLNLVACDICKRLHCIDKTRRGIGYWGVNPRETRDRMYVLPCWTCTGRYISEVENLYFNSVLAQMAMKLDGQGKRTERFTKCLSHRPYLRNFNGRLLKLDSDVVKIVNHKLLRRRQIVFFCSSYSFSDDFTMLTGLSRPCQHWSYTWYNTHKDFSDILKRRFETRHEEEDVFKNGQRRHHCWSCKTEFQVDFKDIGDWGVNALATIITVWQELDGYFFDGRFYPRHHGYGVDQDLTGTEIRRKFDNEGPSVQFEEGRSKIAKPLWTKKTRRTMLTKFDNMERDMEIQGPSVPEH